MFRLEWDSKLLRNQNLHYEHLIMPNSVVIVVLGKTEIYLNSEFLLVVRTMHKKCPKNC